jgi:sec-independent protein translocase protein TatC
MADADAVREGGVPERALQTGGPTPPPTPAAPGDEKVMSLVDHLSELRSRIVRIVLAILVGSAIGFYFANPLIALLAGPAGGTLQNLAPGDAFFIFVRVSVVTGIILAMPVILYQLWAFIAPGLTPTEQKAIRPWIPLALVFFALGVGIAWFVLPYALGFLLSFGTGVFENKLAASPYFDFVTTMFLAFGIVMEFPILLVGLARVGILSSDRLRQARRFVILGIAIFAATATPGGDLVSPFVLGGTMYLLYEGTILFIRRTGR